MKNELVSIVVPVYNVENYLEKCINSLLQQTYKEIEIILVDDGSTDRSGIICDSYLEIDKRINVIHKKNEGLGYARNSGLDVANGKYVYFIDSDDFISEDIVQKLVTTMKRNSCDTVIGGYTRIDEDSRELYKTNYNSFLYQSNYAVRTKLFPRLIGSSPFKRDSIRMSVWNVLFSMSIIKENNICFLSERNIVSEDIIWDIDYYKYANKVFLINFTDYFYRKRGSSLTDINDPNFLQKIKRLYQFEVDRIGDNLTADVKFRIEREYFINLVSCFNQAAKDKKISLAIKKIRVLVNDSFIQKKIQEYPYKETNTRTRIFLTLIMQKKIILLLLLFRYFI